MKTHQQHTEQILKLDGMYQAARAKLNTATEVLNLLRNVDEAKANATAKQVAALEKRCTKLHVKLTAALDRRHQQDTSTLERLRKHAALAEASTRQAAAKVQEVNVAYMANRHLFADTIVDKVADAPWSTSILYMADSIADVIADRV